MEGLLMIIALSITLGSMSIAMSILGLGLILNNAIKRGNRNDDGKNK